MARTSATYQRRNQLAQSRGFRNYYEQRKALEYFKTGEWARGWRDVFGTNVDLRNPEVGRLAGEYWNIIVSGKGNSDVARQVLDAMEGWVDRHDIDWRTSYMLWRDFYKTA